MSNDKIIKKERKDQNQNIQVFVRLRPLNQREKDIKSLGVVEVVNGREVVVRSSHILHTKRFTFDRAFPPHSKQVEIYQDVVSPLIEEVLAGYNCTVFAYGQTGTGKTHTMVGEAAADETTWQNDPMAGIIPRALSQLFDELRLSNTEYTVRVSYLELYNEELFDLLANSDDNSKLRIYEDVTRKGSNIVNGLEEITVYNKNEVYRIMAQGQERKRVASTLMNSQSSRSHTVFTIVVHMKENSPEGEELVKIGKLNLVDLAGSENISKAGTGDPGKRERARECVNINQSLLTLGRVITALVERHPHIPYRESKLTRILQESLGGRTKTSIIATISPGHKDIEETLSTLEYANRAKNIQNKPEINQKMTKKAILKEYAEEIDKLKKDLQAARDKNGIYLAHETYSEMTFKQEEQRKEIQELLLKKRAMEEEKERMEAVFKELNDQLQSTTGKLDVTLNKLSSTEAKLTNTTNKLHSTVQQCEEQRHLVSQQQKTEQVLSTQALQLLAAADAAAADAGRLHDSVDKRRSVESTNLEITRTYREISMQHREIITSGADRLVGDVTSAVADIQTTLETFTESSVQLHEESRRRLATLMQAAAESVGEMMKAKNVMYEEMEVALSGQRGALVQAERDGRRALADVLGGCAALVAASLQRARDLDLCALMDDFLGQWGEAARGRVAGLRETHGAAGTRVSSAAELQAAAARCVRDAATGRADARARRLRRVLQVFIEDKEQNEETLTKELASFEIERELLEKNLSKWIEKKKRLLEEEIEERVRMERSNLEKKIQISKDNIEKHKKLFEERTARNVEWLKEILEESEKEKLIAEEEFRESQTKIDECLKDLHMFAHNCEEGTAAVSTSIDALLREAPGVVGRLKTELLHSLQESQMRVQEQTEKLLKDSTTSADGREAQMTAALEMVGNCCRRGVDQVLGGVEQNTSSTVSALGALSADVDAAAALAHSHRQRQAASLNAAQHSLEQFYGGLRAELGQLSELESRCLHQEYVVYTPTGHTPARTQYRYPRALVATSPHERILARYRARLADSADDACFVVESEVEGRASDAESSASEEPNVPPHPNSALIKCTSETDIYLRRRQYEQGKENVNRSMSFKKPSKLPAPSSLKKPLVDRNADQ